MNHRSISLLIFYFNMLEKKFKYWYDYKPLLTKVIFRRAFEGEIQYATEHNNKYFLITDSSTLADLIDEFADESISVIEFEDKNEFEQYLKCKKN